MQFINKYTVLTVTGLLLMTLGYGVGRYIQPAKIQIKTEVQTKEVQVDHKNVVTVVREEKRPDGTDIIETKTQDKSVDDTNTATKEQTSEAITNTKPQWHIQGSAGVSFDHSFPGTSYGIGVERRILGPVFVGGYIRPNTSEGGVTLSWEF